MVFDAFIEQECERDESPRLQPLPLRLPEQWIVLDGEQLGRRVIVNTDRPIRDPGPEAMAATR
jgi:hypothetical protein